MTYTDVWVGEFTVGDDPLNQDGEWDRGITPLTPLFPPAPHRPHGPFHAVCDRIRAGRYRGRQIDWGAWAAIVTKQDVAALIDEVYGTEPVYAGLDHLQERLADLRSAVQALPAEGRYVLVAEEF